MGKKQAAGGATSTTRAGHNEHLGKPATAKGRILLLLSQMLIGLGIACLVVGAALLQNRIKSLTAATARRAGSYDETLQSAGIAPYSVSHRHQWEFLWWIVGGQSFLWVLSLLLVIRAARIVQWHASLAALHAYFLVLCTIMIDAFLWLDRSASARGFLGHNRIRVVLAGLFAIAIGNGLAILALGMINSTKHIDSRKAQSDRVAPVADYDTVHHDNQGMGGMSTYKNEAPMAQTTGAPYSKNAPHLRTDVP